MSDGRIQIDIDIDGKPIKTVVNYLDDLGDASKKNANEVEEIGDALDDIDSKSVKKAADDVEEFADEAKKGKQETKGFGDETEKSKKKVKEFGDQTQKGGKSLKDFVIALGAVKVASAVFNALKDSLDGAIARFDTFEKFPKVMSALGFGAEESQDAINQLSGAIDGLPTTLDDIVASAQNFVGINGSLSRSTEIAEALNNAFLASGSSSADAARGAEQYSQMLGNGTVDMMSWRSINETMGLSLNYVAKEMLGASATSMDLYAAIKGGDIAFRDFENRLIEVGTGTGELAKLAKENSKGIATSFGNLKNATVKGMANIIKSIDKVVKKATGKNIAENLDSLKVVVNGFFDATGKGFEFVTPLIIVLVKSFDMLYKSGKTLSPVIYGLASAFAAYKIITSVTTWMRGYGDAVELASKASGLLTISIKSKSLATLADIGMTKAHTAAEIEGNTVMTLGTAIVGILTGRIKAVVVAKAAWTTATTVLNGALTFLATNPIGMAVAAIGTLVAATVALVKWFGRATDTEKEMNKAVEDSRAKTDELTDSVKKSSNARQEEYDFTKRQTEEYKASAKAIVDLASKEKMSAGEKRELKDMIAELNRTYTDLNLVYDENTGKLNTNNEALQARLDAYAAHDEALKAEENLNAVKEEGLSIDKQLNDVRKETEEVRNTAVLNQRKQRKNIKDLEEQEATLVEAQRANSEEYKRLQEEKKLAYQEYATAEAEATANQVLTYETLSSAQQQAVDSMAETWTSYAEQARNMFSTLSDEQTMTVEEMRQNLLENQRVIGEWGTNIAELSKRGVDEGLLNTLREAGPSSAGYVAALVQSSDSELQGLSTAFKNGGDTATQALRDAFNLGSETLPAEVQAMVTKTKESLASQIESADFKSLGKNIPEGAKNGVQEGTPEFEDSNKELAKKGADAFKQENEIQSPSKLYQSFGGFIVDGLVNGVQQRQNMMISALTKLSTQMKEPFKNLPNDMMAVGRNTMSSLASGINSNSGSALSAARSVANQISNILNSAKRVSVASYGVGSAVGASVASYGGPSFKSSGETPMAKGATLGFRAMAIQPVQLAKFTPEEALGVDSMSNYQTFSKSSSSSRNASLVINNQGMLDGAVFHVREEADIPKIAKEIKDYEESKNSNRYPWERR